ncbi:class C beta-lactamase [Photobacterium atrarenae]|uniref:Beta-lactamase n=1 Tax=Photobacterium atrarenae TaxID=865757 RepID=A0ABY5GP08_9GAMM|nr:class C beta-lactamase [Photobacterium atrarenae]UTV30648.1 beta-lactamase [Photobacterium atrarenae]
MIKIRTNKLVVLVATSILGSAMAPVFAETNTEFVQSVVDEKTKYLMDKYDIPGMSVAITVDGKQYFYNYGMADKERNQPVSENTIFELGSISKTFTATLAGYAQGQGNLSLDDKVEKHIPALQDSRVGEMKLIHLATYTAGGLPLQFPDEVTNQVEMLQYYNAWTPKFSPGKYRQYSNPSIGFYGHIAALSMNSDYSELMENTILPKLNMASTFINVPDDKLEDYAFGYNSNGDAVRVNPGILDAEAYGVKSTSSDMINYVESNLGVVSLDKDIANALNSTHIGYYKTSTFTQALGWEAYAYPVTLDTLLEGNSTDTILNPKPVESQNYAESLPKSVWVNKTGSTGGFGAYVAYIPEEKAGIVILANKNYPNSERVTAAFDILESIL